jgi:hypothetical protein
MDDIEGHAGTGAANTMMEQGSLVFLSLTFLPRTSSRQVGQQVKSVPALMFPVVA